QTSLFAGTHRGRCGRVLSQWKGRTVARRLARRPVGTPRPPTRTWSRSRPRCSTGWSASSPHRSRPGGQEFAEVAPLLVALAEASAPGRHRHRPRRGCPVLHVRDVAATVDAFVMGRLRAQVESYNLQAATRIAANDREALERMGRYLARRLRSRQIGCYSSMTDVSSCTSSAPGEMAP